MPLFSRLKESSSNPKWYLLSDSEQREIISRTPLLQHGSLRQARPIEKPDKLDRNQLRRLHHLCHLYCDTHHFTAIAVTEIDQSVLNNFAIPTTLDNTIFFLTRRTDDKHHHILSGQLLIKPQVARVSPGSLYIGESCGSIENLGLAMWTLRPKSIDINGYTWSPDQDLIPVNLCLTGPAAYNFDHESTHLDGLTALNKPELILDFRRLASLNAWEGLTGLDFRTSNPNQLMSSYRHRWLVWDRDQNKFLVVTPQGEFIEELKV